MIDRRLAPFLVALLSLSVCGAEIDSVTGRNERLRNSLRPVNARLDAMLRAGVERANQRGRGCDEAYLYRSIRRSIAFPFIGHSVAEAFNRAEDLDSRRVRLRDSIYRDLGPFEAISVHLKNLSAVVRLDDDLVGVDKFGHFLVEGWKYFELAYLSGREAGIERAIAWGESAERTYFGLLTTGIYSYADLAANFEGMRFWLRILGHEKDPLEKGYFFNRSYVRCKTRFWKRTQYWKVRRRVDLSDYANAAWDEAMNCSRYRNQEVAERIRARVRDREEFDARSYACPLDPRRCVKARERYGAQAAALLHPRCLDAAPR